MACFTWIIIFNPWLPYTSLLSPWWICGNWSSDLPLLTPLPPVPSVLGSLMFSFSLSTRICKTGGDDNPHPPTSRMMVGIKWYITLENALGKLQNAEQAGIIGLTDYRDTWACGPSVNVTYSLVPLFPWEFGNNSVFGARALFLPVSGIWDSERAGSFWEKAETRMFAFICILFVSL